VFLVLYSVYAFFRPALKPVTVGGIGADAAVGFANGLLAGLTGLAGILVTIWTGLRGWSTFSAPCSSRWPRRSSS
jgi:hypothetical protein